jgi:hypothetical protein
MNDELQKSVLPLKWHCTSTTLHGVTLHNCHCEDLKCNTKSIFIIVISSYLVRFRKRQSHDCSWFGLHYLIYTESRNFSLCCCFQLKASLTRLFSKKYCKSKPTVNLMTDLSLHTHTCCSYTASSHGPNAQAYFYVTDEVSKYLGFPEVLGMFINSLLRHYNHHSESDFCL